MAIELEKTFDDDNVGKYWVITNISLRKPGACVQIKCWKTQAAYNNGKRFIRGSEYTFSYSDGFSVADMNASNPYKIAYALLMNEPFLAGGIEV